MRIEKDEVLSWDFVENDLPLMYKWLTDDRVLEYYEGRDIRFFKNDDRLFEGTKSSGNHSS